MEKISCHPKEKADMKKKLALIIIIPLIAALIGVSKDFCLELASLLLLLLVVEDLLRQGKQMYPQAAFAYIVSAALCIASVVMGDSSRPLILYIFFTFIVAFDCFFVRRKK